MLSVMWLSYSYLSGLWYVRVTSSRRASGASGVATFTVGAKVYAIVGGYHDNGVQLIDVSDPSNPRDGASPLNNTDNEERE